MSRVFDRGAVVAAAIGVGMAVTMAIGFLLVIPIELVYVVLSLPAGMMIGYYANARSGRERGAWRRILPNSLLAGAVTGLSLAALLLGTRALFFFGDSGFPDFNRTDDHGAPVGATCRAGADCVFQRYQKLSPATLTEAGVADAAAFSDAYWAHQWSIAELDVGLTTGAALLGGILFGVAGPRRGAVAARSATPA